MVKRSKILVLGDDMRVFLAVTRALGRAGHAVYAAPFDRTAPALSSRYVTVTVELPDYATNKKAWVVALLALQEREQFDLVIPCTDPRIIMLHENRADLAHIRLAIPSPDAMEWLFDKELTHEMCNALGVNVAPAARLEEKDTADGLIGTFKLPFVIKPRRSYWNDQLGSADKVHIIESREQLELVLPQLVSRERWLVEGYFEGVGTGVSVIAHNGKIQHAFQHRRLREGKGGASSYRISEALHAGMLSDCEKICAHMKHTGVCMFEFRFDDRSGRWILLESNARFWGSMALAVAAGADYPNFLHQLMVHGIAAPQQKFRIGLRSRNFLLDGLNILRHFGREKSVGTLIRDIGDFALQPVRWVFGRETSDGFAMDDLKPGFSELKQTLIGKR
jgi:predicted ATP-grasp superfamily ATP-dependent carboligase